MLYRSSLHQNTSTTVSRVSTQGAILNVGENAMRPDDAEMLAALRQSLNDLENVKLLNPDDLEIIALKASLRERIASIQNADAEGK